jgi:hypothetical protein
MITKFATPFYPERFVRGNLNYLQNRLNRIFYKFINHMYFRKKYLKKISNK